MQYKLQPHTNRDLNFVIQSYFKEVSVAKPVRDAGDTERSNERFTLTPEPPSSASPTASLGCIKTERLSLSAVVLQIEAVTVSDSVTAPSCFSGYDVHAHCFQLSVGTLMAQSQLHKRIEAFKWQLPQRCAQFGVSAVFRCAFRSTERSPSKK
jgi:hypothetical protein